MFHYIYKLTHTNGRYYIGRHSTKDVNDKYMGSGLWPRNIKDKSSLTKEILSFHTTPVDLKVAEKQLLDEHVGRPMCMNFNNNPIGFSSGHLNPAKSEKEKLRKSKLTGESSPMHGKTHTVESRQKMSLSRQGKDTWNKGLQGIKTSNKGQTAWNKGLHTGHQSFTGKSHSPESIAQMKEKHANRERLACPHCNKVIDKPNYSRYHGDKCKLNQS